MTYEHRHLKSWGYCEYCGEFTNSKVIIWSQTDKELVLFFCSTHIDSGIARMNLDDRKWAYVKNGRFFTVGGDNQ
ncbi:MAG: hypothetical protein ACTSWQ_05035 [Candidatus Thorarchaeota archaeon]